MELILKEVEVSRLNLQSGDVLAVNIKSDDVDYEAMNSFREGFSKAFPNNKVFVTCIGLNNELRFSIINDSNSKNCSTENYCSDCNCGKKQTEQKG